MLWQNLSRFKTRKEGEQTTIGIKELQKLLEQQHGQNQLSSELKNLFEQLRGKPFYCGLVSPNLSVFASANSANTQLYCCLWHTFTPTKSDGRPSELHPFQENVIRELSAHKRLAVLKARNLGLSQLALMYALYMTLCKQLPGNYAFITGIGFELSRSLARRVRAMLQSRNIYFDDNSTTLTFSDNIRWSFYGSDSKAWRGQSDIVFLCCDEFAYFDPSEDWRASIDTYAIKNAGAYIFLITTPSNNVNGMAHRLFKEVDSLYKRIYLPYTVGVGSMYKPEQIELLKRTSPSFEVEYNLKWGYTHEGSCFNSKDIDAAIARPYEVDYINPHGIRSIGIDCGFGSSAFSVTVCQYNNSIIEVSYSREWERVDFIQVLNEVVELYRKYEPCRIYIDGSNPEFVRALKAELGDTVDYERIISEAKRDKIDPEQRLERVIPNNFGVRHRELLMHCKMCLESSQLAIDERFERLIQSLRGAVEKDGSLDKSQSPFNDSLDSFRLALQGFKYD